MLALFANDAFEIAVKLYTSLIIPRLKYRKDLFAMANTFSCDAFEIAD